MIRGLLIILALLGPEIAWGQTGQFNPAAAPVSNQAWNAVAVTPGSQSIPPTRAIYNGGSAACAIVVQPNGASSGTTVTFANVQPGEILPVQATAITGSTTCTGVVALY